MLKCKNQSLCLNLDTTVGAVPSGGGGGGGFLDLYIFFAEIAYTHTEIHINIYTYIYIYRLFYRNPRSTRCITCKM